MRCFDEQLMAEYSPVLDTRSLQLCFFIFMGVDVCGTNDCGICAYGTFKGMISHNARAECRSRYMRRLFTCFQMSRHAGIVSRAGRAGDSKQAREGCVHE